MANRLFAPLAPGQGVALKEVLELIDVLFPLPKRFRVGLPQDVRRLSQLLTSERQARQDGYLGKDALISAYMRYFLPWNLYRLGRLLPALDLNLKNGDRIIDLGTGPLTLPLALLLFRPDLHRLDLEFVVVDRTSKIMENGQLLFSTLKDAYPSAWRIKLLRQSFGQAIDGKKAALITAINVLNEVNRSRAQSLEAKSGQVAEYLLSLGSDRARFLVVEPGTPPSARELVALRSALLDKPIQLLTPCPHARACPMPSIQRAVQGPAKKWCHFTFDDQGAPRALRELSLAAGLPKDRLALSFLFFQPGELGSEAKDTQAVRLISEAFPLPGRGYGRYGCAAAGLMLLAGPRQKIEALEIGSIFPIGGRGKGGPLAMQPPQRDAKSGAWLVEV